MIKCERIVDSINMGIVTLDEDLKILYVNQWFAIHRGKKPNECIGFCLCDLFRLSTSQLVALKRHIKTALSLQTPSFYTADAHGYLLPMKHSMTTKSAFEYMQQDITIVPYDVALKQVTLLIYDQTVLMEEKSKCYKESMELAKAHKIAQATIKKLQNAQHKLVKQQEIIYKQAHHDQLTGLANRMLLHERMQLLMEEGFTQDKPFSVLFLDLDNFKEINDTLGHDAGDTLLAHVAKRLLGLTRKSDTVARLGGDEFIILLDGMDDAAMLETMASKIIRAICEPVPSAEKTLHVTISIGISRFPEDGTDYNQLIKSADRALYEAKNAGRNTFRLFASQV